MIPAKLDVYLAAVSGPACALADMQDSLEESSHYVRPSVLVPPVQSKLEYSRWNLQLQVSLAVRDKLLEAQS